MIKKYADLKGQTDSKGQPLVKIIKTKNSVAVSTATFDPSTGVRGSDYVEQVFPENLRQEKASLLVRVSEINLLLNDIENTKETN